MSELEQFCTIAASQKGRACASIIKQVLSHRNIFVFGEFLTIPSVQALRESEFFKSFNTLELFAYGSYSDYKNQPEKYLELNEMEQTKLRQLSIITIGNQNKIIPYSTLQNELHLDNIRILEDLIIESIYSGILTGKLDQRAGLLRVQSTIGRDVQLREMQEMMQKLLLWREKCAGLIQAFDQSSTLARTLRVQERGEQQSLQREADAVKATIKESIAFGDVDRSMEEADLERHRTQGRSKRNRAGYFGGTERSRMA